ncbi:MAG: diacylglycerol kinase family protein [Bowdeniella nasicola]|nr:diacylglycerol kinase family protein [Bowdeniella nasicola]
MRDSTPSRDMGEILVVANPNAGRGEALRLVPLVAHTLAQHHRVRTICALDLPHTRRAVREALGGARAVVAIGGDGHVHHLSQELCDTGIPLGIVPAGSGNDIARALNLPLEPREALAHLTRILDSDTTGCPIDVLDVEGTDFHARVLAVLSLGFDARVNQRAVSGTHGFGRWRYLAAVIAELWRLRIEHYTVRIDGGEARTVTGLLASIANLGYFGSGMLLAPHADPRDGIADLITVAPVPRTEFLRVFPRIFTGTHLSHPAISVQPGFDFHLEADTDVVVHGDGEALGHMPVRVGVRKGALTLLTGEGTHG